MGWLTDLYEIAKSEGWVQSFKNLFSNPPKILVLGSTGCGKSQVISYLKDGREGGEIPAEIRTPSPTLEPLRLLGNYLKFVDTPGDVDFKDSRSQAINDAIKDKYNMFINVVSAGFHEYNYGSNHNQALDKNNQPNPDWIKAHLARESNMLSEWIHLLKLHSGTPHVVTVINKADLWWDSRERTRSLYASSSEYGKTIAQIPNARHSVYEFCAKRRPFFSAYTPNTHLSDATQSQLFSGLASGMLTSLSRQPR